MPEARAAGWGKCVSYTRSGASLGTYVGVQVLDGSAGLERLRRQRGGFGLAWATIQGTRSRPSWRSQRVRPLPSIALIGFGLDSTVEVVLNVGHRLANDPRRPGKSEAPATPAHQPVSYPALAGYVAVQAVFKILSGQRARVTLRSGSRWRRCPSS